MRTAKPLTSLTGAGPRSGIARSIIHSEKPGGAKPRATPIRATRETRSAAGGASSSSIGDCVTSSNWRSGIRFSGHGCFLEQGQRIRPTLRPVPAISGARGLFGERIVHDIRLARIGGNAYMATMPPTDDELKALQWRAWHRGTREADLMIGGFFDAHHQQWGSPERGWFPELLQEQDVDIMAWAIGTADAAGALPGSNDGRDAAARLSEGAQVSEPSCSASSRRPAADPERASRPASCRGWRATWRAPRMVPARAAAR